MSRPSLVIVLAEDLTQQRLIRCYLKRVGYRLRDIRWLDLPAGSGSGEQFVRKQYAAEVRGFRRRQHRAETALIIFIDADMESTARRRQQLFETLNAEDQPLPDTNEPIFHLIPKRHVETWILCLIGDSVDETTDYKRLHHGQLWNRIEGAVEALRRWQGEQNLPDHCVPSLEAAIPEFRRLR